MTVGHREKGRRSEGERSGPEGRGLAVVRRMRRPKEGKSPDQDDMEGSMGLEQLDDWVSKW